MVASAASLKQLGEVFEVDANWRANDRRINFAKVLASLGYEPAEWITTRLPTHPR